VDSRPWEMTVLLRKGNVGQRQAIFAQHAQRNLGQWRLGLNKAGVVIYVMSPVFGKFPGKSRLILPVGGAILV